MSHIKNFWDANTYSQFIDARTRPARDLLSAISTNVQPNIIYDLGCGPGNSTVLLSQRWPNAKVIGVDSSEDMLKLARSDYPEIEFLLADIENFSTDEKIDLLFANASLQWVDNHELVISTLTQQLNTHGVLAIQMPNNFHYPSHQITIEILSCNPSWKPLLKGLRYSTLTVPLYKLNNYYDFFAQSGLNNITLWETDYYQEMEDHHAIFEWSSGTGLRPVLSKMDEKDQALFAKQYVEQLKQAYILQPNGKVLFPFKRIFMVGYKSKVK